QTKLDLTQVSGLLNYWNMLGDGMDYVVEATGRGNHLFFVPRGPVTDNASGGKDGRSWFFNGQTSYAKVDLSAGTSSNPNWRYSNNGAQPGALLHLVRNNRTHGFAVEFWLDSIEPQYEQVICEIHGAMRLAVNTDGKLICYVRKGDALGAYAATSLHIG